MFDAQKTEALKKQDNSKKGSVDEQIKPLLDCINSKKDFYTTSSCAGRIVLFVEPKSQKKKDAHWLYVSHDEARLADMGKSLESLPDEPVWLRMEPFIIHLCVRDIEKANDLMATLRSVGLKHSGILSTRKRIMVEIVGHERVDTPISEVGSLQVQADYIVYLVDKANIKLKRTRDKMQKLLQSLEKFS